MNNIEQAADAIGVIVTAPVLPLGTVAFTTCPVSAVEANDVRRADVPHAGDGSRICAHLRKANVLVAYALACLATDSGD